MKKFKLTPFNSAAAFACVLLLGLLQIQQSNHSPPGSGGRRPSLKHSHQIRPDYSTREVKLKLDRRKNRYDEGCPSDRDTAKVSFAPVTMCQRPVDQPPTRVTSITVGFSHPFSHLLVNVTLRDAGHGIGAPIYRPEIQMKWGYSRVVMKLRTQPRCPGRRHNPCLPCWSQSQT